MSMPGRILTTDEFLAHALAIEREAAARYRDLSDQMRAHHNGACAALFDWLAIQEQNHAHRLEQRIAGTALPSIAPWDYRWPQAEAPETTAFDEAHYLMTPYHLLHLALNNEQRAAAFFQGIADSTHEPELNALATEFAAEEREHVEMISDLLGQQAVPHPDWAQDFDPPVEPA